MLLRSIRQKHLCIKRKLLTVLYVFLLLQELSVNRNCASSTVKVVLYIDVFL